MEVITAPVELLAEINIVDTPGTNAILREHEAITRTFVPRSGLGELALDVFESGEVALVKREFRFRLADVDNVLHELEKRGNDFFDELMRLARVLDLINKSKVKADFERRVVADMPQRIDRRVSEVINWLVDADLRQWQAVTERLAERQHAHADRMVGRIGGGFDVDRGRLLESAGRAARQSVEMYDQEGESTRLAESVQIAVAGTALAEAGGPRPGDCAHSPRGHGGGRRHRDPRRLGVAVLGLFIIPNRCHAAKRELGVKIAALRERLMATLTGQFDREIERSVSRINEAIAPYTRFVRAEREQLQGAREDLQKAAEALSRLRTRIEEL